MLSGIALVIFAELIADLPKWVYIVLLSITLSIIGYKKGIMFGLAEKLKKVMDLTLSEVILKKSNLVIRYNNYT